jgi:CheY-like chemotaxis protein
VDWEQAEADKAKISFEVEDSGCGIKEQAIPGLFDSFQRADLRRNIDIQGTGLGLAIVKKLVESLGGEISVESVYGSGSKFSFYIFHTITDATPIGDFSEIELRNTGNREEGEDFIAPDARVLCVDDNATNRKVIKELMSIYRMQVDTAGSGEECIKLLEEGKLYHIIFMDQMMPGMDGIETAEAIRTMSGEVRRIPIIALTANALSGAKEMFLEKGFQNYLAKPVELDELKDILLEYLPEKTICYIDNKDTPGEYGKAIVLPGADTKAGLARFGGERNRYLQALKFFYDDGEKQMERMKGFLEKKDDKGYGLEVHALKGLALGIGAYRLSDMARDQEAAAAKGEIDQTGRQPQELLAEYELLIANIRFVLKENGYLVEEAPIKATKEALPKEEFEKKIKEITDALEMLDENNAERMMRELLTTKMDENKRKLLLKAKEQIQNFDYEEALESIESLTE